MRALLASSLKTARYDGTAWKDAGVGPGSRQGDYIDWLTIRNQAESVATDVERIREHPLVSREIAIHGYVYEVETGRLVEVPAISRTSLGVLISSELIDRTNSAAKDRRRGWRRYVQSAMLRARSRVRTSISTAIPPMRFLASSFSPVCSLFGSPPPSNETFISD
jgi:hypothetical protein